jgi:diguanylate cyclase (GGDEF)-like protein
MSNTQLLLTLILLQQGLFGLLWLGAARLRLARRPAWHWAAMAGLVALGMSLLLQRGQAPLWVSVGLGNALMLAAFVALRRGVQRFAHAAPGDREHAVVLAAGAISALATAVPGLHPLPAVLLAGVSMAWTLLRGAGEIRRGLAAEFGRSAAWWCAAPMALLALLFLFRSGVALTLPEAFQNYLRKPGGDSPVPAYVALIFSLLLQANLIALVMLRLVRRLQYQSDHDMLTGLLSRRPMESLLQAETQRQQRFGRPFALLSIDIDHFKQINDRWGHAVGDEVLKRVAQALHAHARDVDSVARMGGEEFCVLLPAADLAGAEGVATRMLEAVRTLNHPETDGALQVTISIGVAVMEEPAEPIQALQRRLDQALYSAKAEGRNRVRHAAPAVTAPFNAGLQAESMAGD